MSTTKQSTFQSKEQKTAEILTRANNQGLHEERLVLAVSGGLDSAVAATVMCEMGPEYGFHPDAVIHINMGESPRNVVVNTPKLDLNACEHLR